MNSIQILDVSHGFDLTINTDGEMSSLTDLWRATGSIETKAPKFWLDNEQTKSFIQAVSRLQKVTPDYLIKVKRGKGGGTWAHKLIVSEYAQYLNPDLAVLVNRVFFERVAEEKNPDLIVDRAFATYKKHGKSDEWIGKRLEGKYFRNTFTTTLAAHGVDKDGFRDCTNAIYKPLFGGKVSEVKTKRNIPQNANFRDTVSVIELESIKFSESLASEKIKKQNISGNYNCEMASLNASQLIAQAVKQYLNS